MKKFRRFGAMLDCSRNGVMRVSEVMYMIDCLRKMGYNTLELYMEDTYELKGEPYFGYLRGRYTNAEIKELDAYAKARGIELIPCVQTLGHLQALSRHGQYASIMDAEDVLLVDEPKTYAFIEKIFAWAAENFTSRNIHIGMDEASNMGLGKYLDKHGFKNRKDLFMRHLTRVAEIAKKYGFTAQIWSDMLFRLQGKGEYYAKEPVAFAREFAAQIPSNVELVYWDYYHHDKKSYDVMLRSHKSLGKNTWFAGGAWTWNGFAPMNGFALQTMKAAMQSVIDNEVNDVLITCWGDDGKECSYFAALPALYAIRQYADGNFNQESIEKGFYKLFKIPFADFMALDLPNCTGNKALDKEGNERVQNPCKSLLYSDPFMGIFDKLVAQERAIPYGDYAARLKKIAKKAGVFEYIFDTASKLCLVLALKSELGVRTRRAYQSNSKDALKKLIKDYMQVEKRLVVFHGAFMALWHKENKPQGWEVQDIRLGGLLQRVRTCREKLQKFVKGKQGSIKELEEDLLACGEDGFQCGRHASIISMGTL